MSTFVEAVSAVTGRAARRLRGALKPDPDPSEPSPADAGETDDYTSDASLFRCSHCDVTFISLEMESCPRCSNPVDTTPTEVELGMV